MSPRNNKEWRLQSFVDRFIDRVVLPPMWVTGIDHASNVTDNARARARGRGIKSGVPDVYVAQGHPARTAWIELKRGTKPSDAQLAVFHALDACEVPCFVATDIKGVLVALHAAGFRLHGNAVNITAEIEAKLEAADRAAAEEAPRKFSGKPRAARPTRGQVAAGHRFAAARLGLGK